MHFLKAGLNKLHICFSCLGLSQVFVSASPKQLEKDVAVALEGFQMKLGRLCFFSGACMSSEAGWAPDSTGPEMHITAHFVVAFILIWFHAYLPSLSIKNAGKEKDKKNLTSKMECVFACVCEREGERGSEGEAKHRSEKLQQQQMH